MKSEEWKQIDELFQETLSHAPGNRAAFLDRACAGNENMRREVESLLAHDEQARCFLEQPPAEIAAELLAAERSHFVQGQFISHYRVMDCLGVGGMGEVYLAQDTSLNRRVAIKVLPRPLISDSNRVLRFEQEARAASALNHPNIVTIHEVGEVDGAHFIVAEYIKGQTLGQRLTRSGPMNVGEALDVALQVAHALDAAHSAGIVHRDIKPDNIMLRPDGLIKVLDFGLVKLSDPVAFGSENEDLTRVDLRTNPGAVMGTARYMSPEQAMGQNVDSRTDLWSLGVVLFEMLAGKPPFDGETPSHVIVDVLDSAAPSLAAHVKDLPPGLESIVKKSLCKSADERYQTAKQFAEDLKDLRAQLQDRGTLNEPLAAVTNHSIPKSIHWWKRAAIAVMAALALAAGIFPFLAKPGKPIDSLAVVPFVNAGDDTTEYLSDGISESLVNSLSQIHDLQISPRSVVSQYKDTSLDPSAIGRELGVRAILTGRVASHGEDLDMQVDLLDAKNGSRLWGNTYQRPLIDLLGVQKEIVDAVASTLGVQRGAPKADTNSKEAYQLYLQGRYYGQKQTGEGIQKTGDYFKRAIAADPYYALAYVGLADYYGHMAAGGLAPGAEYWPKSEEAAIKALALDESLGGAHASLAVVRIWYDRDWLGAESELKRAIELNPDAYTMYARLLVAMGRFDEAFAAAKRYSEVDPHKKAFQKQWGQTFAELYFYARRYDLAIEKFRESIKNDSGDELPHIGLAEVYVQQQKFTEALAEARKAKDLIRNPGQLARLGAIFAAAGDTKEATEILVKVKDVSSKRVAFNTASIYAALGNRTEAIAWLTKAVDEFDTMVMNLKVDPRFDSLRQDPRFTALLGRMHLLQ